MIKSMTAFGRAVREGETRDVAVEVRSVNSRFYDCSVRMPRAYAVLEDRIRTYVQKNAVSRAKVEVSVTVTDHTAEGAVIPDLAYARQYVEALRTLRDVLGLPDDISVMTVARNPEVMTRAAVAHDPEALWDEIRPVLDEALAGYTVMRTAEGAKLEEDLYRKLDHVRDYAAQVEEISATDTVGYRDKLETRLRRILGENAVTVDENRLLTECAIWTDKIAIDEELTRLRSHFGAFREIAAAAEPSGRKLDFLMQELNRETNTIGSKANNARIARLVVDMKGELEKMREQIQNIE